MNGPGFANYDVSDGDSIDSEDGLYCATIRVPLNPEWVSLWRSTQGVPLCLTVTHPPQLTMRGPVTTSLGQLVSQAITWHWDREVRELFERIEDRLVEQDLLHAYRRTEDHTDPLTDASSDIRVFFTTRDAALRFKLAWT